MSDFDVVVIGAGLGGLSSGALLAESGRRVLVLEQAGQIGGCCSTFELSGYRFDVGASIVEIIRPIEEVFKRLRTTFQKEVDLIACDPIMSVINRDGSRITYPLSVHKTGEIISEIDAEDGRRWLDFVDFASELMEVTLNTFFCMPANDLGDMVAMMKRDPRLAKFIPTFLSSYQDVLQHYFKNETVLRTMGYQSLYFGYPPALVPGPFAMVPYSEHCGIYYPRGGMIRIPEALQRCGEGFGMQVRLNTAVERVLVRGGRVAGVRLADGQEISAPVVVSNINAKTLYQEMIEADQLPPAVQRGIRSYAYSTACPMVYVGLDCAPPLDAHHSLVGLSPEEVNRYWWNNVEKGILPDEHFALICWPSHSDDTLAPAGKHVLNIIPEGFYHLANNDWDSEKPLYLQRTLDFISDLIMPDLAKHVTVMDCATPLDFERRLMLPQGAIYSLQQDLTAQAVFRPASRSKSVKGLYLAGSSTHPGGGVPTTIASGLIAANQIGRDQ